MRLSAGRSRRVRTSLDVLVEIEIERPRSEVWSFLADVERIPDWDGPPLPSAGGAVRPRGSQTLTDAGEGRTRLVSRYQPELIGTLVLLRPYLKRWLRRQRRADAQTLKALLEARAP